ncbi:hypothetical protein PDG61_29855 [Mycolicibacterium sp. BiH015]|uniref:hypothetical protein n=1 Tax=Mycolicibacterium sp. BiH015 TaxID=3018808 RepID=UPI0022E3DD5B|nr:hypothetical protein [Mycolicibacterium sp. BiH015]MDA2895152.1 hypothetical protein [Mycolicibacterium sp. BiH015]
MSEIQVVVYSSNAATRRYVIDTVGRYPGPASARLCYLEIATAAALVACVDTGEVGLAILDGEAAPAGGIGMARRLKDELPACPPLIVLLARPVDAWLAKWSNADAAIPWPTDPLVLCEAVSRSLRDPAGSGVRAQ